MAGCDTLLGYGMENAEDNVQTAKTKKKGEKRGFKEDRLRFIQVSLS